MSINSGCQHGMAGPVSQKHCRSQMSVAVDGAAKEVVPKYGKYLHFSRPKILILRQLLRTPRRFI